MGKRSIGQERRWAGGKFGRRRSESHTDNFEPFQRSRRQQNGRHVRSEHDLTHRYSDGVSHGREEYVDEMDCVCE